MLRQIARGSPGTLWRRIIHVADPPAGTDITIVVPPHRAWQLLAVNFVLTASSHVANRYPYFEHLDNDNNDLLNVIVGGAVVANGNAEVTFAAGFGTVTTPLANTAIGPLPTPWFALPGETILIGGSGDSADQVGQASLTVLETNTGDPDYIGSLERRILDHVDALHALTH